MINNNLYKTPFQEVFKGSNPYMNLFGSFFYKNCVGKFLIFKQNELPEIHRTARLFF